MGRLIGLGAISTLVYLRAAYGLGWTSAPADVYLFLAIFGGLFVLYGLAFVSARSIEDKRLPWAILGFAIVFRLAFVGVGLPEDKPFSAALQDLSGDGPAVSQFIAYDNDVWRYLWDGRITARGESVYRSIPDQVEEDDDLWFQVQARVDHGEYRTVYPPFAQVVFRAMHAIAPGSALAFKLLMMCFDIGACFLLWRLTQRLGLSPAFLLLYAWNPLAIKELSGSGHIDAMVVFFLLLAVERILAGGSIVAGISMRLAILTKLTPVAGLATILPFLWKRGMRAFAGFVGGLLAAGILLAIPWRNDIGAFLTNLRTFAADWEFNAGPFRIFRGIGSLFGESLAVPVGQVLSSLVMMGLVLWVWRKRVDLLDALFYLLAAAVWLSPTVMPWYLLWALPFAALRGRLSFVVLTGLSLLSYLVYIEPVESAWWLLLEHGIFALLFVLEQRGRQNSV